jgi:hypothetical protein
MSPIARTLTPSTVAIDAHKATQRPFSGPARPGRPR